MSQRKTSDQNIFMPKCYGGGCSNSMILKQNVWHANTGWFDLECVRKFVSNSCEFKNNSVLFKKVKLDSSLTNDMLSWM